MGFSIGGVVLWEVAGSSQRSSASSHCTDTFGRTQQIWYAVFVSALASHWTSLALGVLWFAALPLLARSLRGFQFDSAVVHVVVCSTVVFAGWV